MNKFYITIPAATEETPITEIAKIKKWLIELIILRYPEIAIEGLDTEAKDGGIPKLQNGTVEITGREMRIKNTENFSGTVLTLCEENKGKIKTCLEKIYKTK